MLPTMLILTIRGTAAKVNKVTGSFLWGDKAITR